MPIELIESHTLLPDLIRPGGLVVDCGANVGAFSCVMIERFGCRVLAFEASPEVFDKIPRLSQLRVRNVAVCGADGLVNLSLDEDTTRNSILTHGSVLRRSVEVPGRDLTNLIVEELKLVRSRF